MTTTKVIGVDEVFDENGFEGLGWFLDELESVLSGFEVEGFEFWGRFESVS